MDAKLNVLLIEDNPGDARLIRELLAGTGDDRFRLQIAVDLAAGLAQLTAGGADVLLLDLSLPDSQGFDSFASIHDRFPALPIIVLTGLDDETLATRAVREGAQDYLVKGQIDGHLLVRAIRYAIERKQNETRLLHLSEVLRAIRNVNQLITHERDPQRLLADACTILVQTRGYRMAWIGLSAEDLGRVIPAARAGKGTAYLDEIIITLDDSATGQGPTATAIRTRQPVACRDILSEPSFAPWREFAQAHGFRSSVAVPMVYGARVFGAVNVYADRTAAFEPEELELLGELAGDLAFGLQSIEDEAERKRAEKALLDSEARFSTVFRASPIPIAIARLTDGCFIDVNAAWQNLIGYTREETIGRIPTELNLWAEPTERDQLIEMLRERGTVQEYECQARQKSGAIITTLMAAELIVVADEPGVLTIAIDITERKQTEEQLRESEERFRVIFENASEAIHFNSADDEILAVNPRMCAFMGYSQEELLKMHVADLMAPEVRPSDHVIVQEFAQHGAVMFEALNLHKDGRRIPVEISIGRIEQPSGDLYVSIVRDITERKQAEARIRQQIDELQRWYDVTLNRETRALELKHEVNELLRRLNEPIRYPSAEK